MTTFHLIRHGERNTPAGVLPGRTAGVRLTEEGSVQADRIARWFAAEPLDRILSSPLERAQATAAPLAKAKAISVETSDAFLEVDYGEWTGRSTTELAPQPAWKNYNQFRSGTRIPGGEAAFEIQARFVGELLRLRDAYPEQRIACVTHADPIRLSLTYFLGAPLDLFDRIEIDVGSISTVQLAPWGVRVLRVNEVPRG